jgi:hypothetical protein
VQPKASESYRTIIKALADKRKQFPKLKRTPFSESASELYRPSDRRLSTNFLPTFVDRECHVVSVTYPYGRKRDFLDWSPYFLFRVFHTYKLKDEKSYMVKVGLKTKAIPVTGLLQLESWAWGSTTSRHRKSDCCKNLYWALELGGFFVKWLK